MIGQYFLHSLNCLLIPEDWGFFFLVGWETGVELRILHLHSRCSTIWATPPVHFALVILEMGVSWTVCSYWPQTMILLISFSQGARITDVSHQCPAQGLSFTGYWRCSFWGTICRLYHRYPGWNTEEVLLGELLNLLENWVHISSEAKNVTL
jgi:hypothetical protein